MVSQRAHVDDKKEGLTYQAVKLVKNAQLDQVMSWSSWDFKTGGICLAKLLARDDQGLYC